jgi:hypothetical protein
MEKVQTRPGDSGGSQAACLPAVCEAEVVSRVFRMGYVTSDEGIDAAMRSLAAHGVCRSAAEQWLQLKPGQHKQRQQLLSTTYRLLEDSPTPATEWAGLREVFGDELLAMILSISPASVRRYAAGERRCPDEVAARLHWLAMVVEHLEGSFNAFGIRRWFQRSRQALGGLSPLAVLGQAWEPESAGPGRLMALAEGVRHECHDPEPPESCRVG